MKHLLLMLALMLNTITFAFESEDSALDFVYESLEDSLWGDSLPSYLYRVGIMERDVDAIVNNRTVFENGDSLGIELDTIMVPKNHYVFFVTTPENYVFKGQSPNIMYMFLSKTDSSYSVVDTVGYPDRSEKWDTIRDCGRVLRDEAIYIMMDFVDFYTDSPIYDVYLIENTKNIVSLDPHHLQEIDENTLKEGWCFIIDIHSEKCYFVGCGRDRNPGGSVSTSLWPLTFRNTAGIDFSTMEGLKFVFNNESNSVINMKSDLDVAVYPNPTSDLISVNIDNCTLSILSNEGELLKRAEESQMDISELPSGIYLLKISKEEKSVVKKIIKK
ncbi:MAG: T9SS type A sorting domain-containing protein [Paludibacteraceae bacterium]|nr:T9SS type A sorting domain-containing protein [Paludibacteraceae bacterium]